MLLGDIAREVRVWISFGVEHCLGVNMLDISRSV